MTYKQALKHYGSVNALADAINISHQAVYKWRKVIPIGSQSAIEVETRGALKADRTRRVK